jgi:hypothetical protein
MERLSSVQGAIEEVRVPVVGSHGEEIRDRQQMAALLRDRMAGSYESLGAGQRLEPDTSLVKSYLVESVLPEAMDADQAQARAADLLTNYQPARQVAIEMRRAEDPSLITMTADVRLNPRPERVVAYIDIANPRFWLVHSMSASRAVDYLIDRLVAAGPELDRAWLPADLLESVSRMGSFRGLGLDYDRRAIPDVDFADPEAGVEFLKMQLWGNKAADVLGILRRHDAFPKETTLAKVKVKYWQDAAEADEFTLDDVKFDGKVTARGTSFDSHVALLRAVYDRYAVAVRDIEDHYRLKGAESEPLRMEGEPVTYLLDPPIADLGRFCDSVFSATPPFRLWGVPVFVGPDYARVDAVDLHVGSRLRVEIAPEMIRVYLYGNACGNSALRMYTNLQHHYNSEVQTRNGRGTQAFQF